MCEVASFKNFENSLATVKVMTKTKVAPFYLGHGVVQPLPSCADKPVLVSVAEMTSLTGVNIVNYN